jgi:hypothetical protein
MASRCYSSEGATDASGLEPPQRQEWKDNAETQRAPRFAEEATMYWSESSDLFFPLTSNFFPLTSNFCP